MFATFGSDGDGLEDKEKNINDIIKQNTGYFLTGFKFVLSVIVYNFSFLFVSCFVLSFQFSEGKVQAVSPRLKS